MRKVINLKTAIAGILITITANSGAVFAQSAKPKMDNCILAVVKLLVRDKSSTSGRNIMSACACITNRLAQGLNPQDCPRFDTASNEDMNRQFKGEY